MAAKSTVSGLFTHNYQARGGGYKLSVRAIVTAIHIDSKELLFENIWCWKWAKNVRAKSLLSRYIIYSVHDRPKTATKQRKKKSKNTIAPSSSF